MALFAVPMAFGLAALCEPTMRLIYGAKYLPAIPVLLVTALFSVGRALQLPVQRLLAATENMSFMVWWGLLLAVINVGTNLLQVPSGGAVGAAYSKGLVQLVAMVGMWAYAAKISRERLPLGRFIGLLLAATGMFGAVWLVSRLLPGDVPDLLVGIPLGVVSIIVLLRLSRFLGPEDRARLEPLQRMLPGSLRSLFGRVVRFVVPEPAVAQPAPGAG
jgi:O-antigen/teichoic acid export membrane protein